MSKNKKQLAILGSTGSIGTQTLSVVSQHLDLFKIFLISANSNHDLLYRQVKKFKPKHVVINTKVGYDFLKKNVNHKTTTVSLGMDALSELVKSDEIDLVLTAVVGSAGLVPTISAISANKNIALANKETLVVGGELIMSLVKNNGVKILPDLSIQQFFNA